MLRSSHWCGFLADFYPPFLNVCSVEIYIYLHYSILKYKVESFSPAFPAQKPFCLKNASQGLDQRSKEQDLNQDGIDDGHDKDLNKEQRSKERDLNQVPSANVDQRQDHVEDKDQRSKEHDL